MAPRASKPEQAWIRIRGAELDYLESNGDQDKYVAYRRSISDALKAYPNDPWLWIQRGLADEGSPITHGQVGGVDTIAFYRTALALAPDNFAAHHYYAHTLANLARTKEALEETAIYLHMAPAIPHAHHMHGHELVRFGADLGGHRRISQNEVTRRGILPHREHPVALPTGIMPTICNCWP